MPAPIALQLYTVREALAQDFEGTVKKIAEMGYVGVETAMFPGTTPEKAANLFADLGLTVTSAHTQLPIGDHKNEVLDLAAALKCRRIVCGGLKPEEHYQSLDQIKRTCDLFNEANEAAEQHGLTFGIHNHWWEYEPVEGQYPYQILLERVDPAVFMEVDIYWVAVAGVDPVTVLKSMGRRAPLLHIKDGPGFHQEPHLALGDGIIDISGVIQAGAENTEWLIVELDHCATDMLEAVERSYGYLVGQGLARGKK